MSNDTILTRSPSDWRTATVSAIRPESDSVRTFSFLFDNPVKHDTGQHYEIRLTAADGYQAARLYSAATPADGRSKQLDLTIALMPGGEVSTYLFDFVKLGSQLEIRGPLGRYFVWTPEQSEPVLLIGGGVGVVPLRAMRLEHSQAEVETPMKLLYSVKNYEAMLYKSELFPGGDTPGRDVVMTFTGHAPKGWSGYARRVDGGIINDILGSFSVNPRAYICGPTEMVETVANLLVQAGLDPSRVSAERFGSTA